jgi:hypothetical protein
LVVVFAVSRKTRMAMMDFGATITLLASPPEEAIETAKHMQQTLREAFGDLELTSDPSVFPFVISANRQRGTVEINLGVPMYSLISNPEVFWVWADKVIVAAREITVH